MAGLQSAGCIGKKYKEIYRKGFAPWMGAVESSLQVKSVYTDLKLAFWESVED